MLLMGLSSKGLVAKMVSLGPIGGGAKSLFGTGVEVFWSKIHNTLSSVTDI